MSHIAQPHPGLFDPLPVNLSRMHSPLLDQKSTHDAAYELCGPERIPALFGQQPAPGPIQTPILRLKTDNLSLGQIISENIRHVQTPRFMPEKLIISDQAPVKRNSSQYFSFTNIEELLRQPSASEIAPNPTFFSNAPQSCALSDCSSVDHRHANQILTAK